MKFKVIFISVLFSILCFSFTSAEVPKMINYQGKLTTAKGKLVDGVFSMIFSIYDSSTGGAALWTESQGTVTVENGIFSVLLGSVQVIPDSVFDGSIRYLGVKVDDDSEMTPRRRIVSVGYAYRTEWSDTSDYSFRTQIADTANYAMEAVIAEFDGDWTIDGDNIYRLTGNIGIGTATPDEKLEVNGNAHITGDLTVDGNIGPFPLKVYDSGWFSVINGGTYVKTHNLGTTKLLVQVFGAENASGTGMALQCIGNQSHPEAGMAIQSITSTQLTIQCAQDHARALYGSEGEDNRSDNGYARVIALALE